VHTLINDHVINIYRRNNVILSVRRSKVIWNISPLNLLFAVT